MGFAQHRQQPKPKNRASVSIAQSAINTMAPQIQEQYANALAVNGYPSLIWTRKQHGRICSCSQHIVKGFTDTVGTFDTDGNASSETIASLTSGFEYRIKRYGEKVNAGNPVPPTTTITEANKFDENKIKTGNELEDDWSVEIEPEEGTVILPNTNLGANPCGVCFNNGVVGGYNLFGGQRLVFDATVEDSKRVLSGYVIDKTERPWKFVATTNTPTAEFTCLLPALIVSGLQLRVFNNLDVVVVESEIWTGSAWVSLTSANLISYATGLSSKVRVKGNIDTKFTHLEITYLVSSTPVYVEYPKITNTADLTAVDAIDSISLNIGPQVSDIAGFDLIYDLVFKKLWRITSTSELVDRNLNPHGWDVNARYVQTYENINSLVSIELVTNSSIYLPRRLR